MQYETIYTEDTQGFHVMFSVAHEESHPRDMFDDSVTDIEELCQKIDDGVYSWFVARVEAYKHGILLGTDYLGGCLYDSPMQFVKEDSYYSDMVDNAISEAKKNLEKLQTV